MPRPKPPGPEDEAERKRHKERTMSRALDMFAAEWLHSWAARESCRGYCVRKLLRDERAWKCTLTDYPKLRGVSAFGETETEAILAARELWMSLYSGKPTEPEQQGELFRG